MKLLELFSGNKSVSKVFKEKQPDVEIVSLDIEQKFKPDVCIDILNWDYKIYPPNHFDVLWASPDCRSWSIAAHGLHRTKLPEIAPKTEIAEIGEKLVLKTLEIIEYFKPKYWFIENPRGLLRHFPVMKTLPHCHLVYYSNHGFPYHKATNIWSNIFLWDNEKKPNVQVEKNYIEKHHSKRSLIPPKLIENIIEKIWWLNVTE
jgi:site-specific DNA-cytosine methylase